MPVDGKTLERCLRVLCVRRCPGGSREPARNRCSLFACLLSLFYPNACPSVCLPSVSSFFVPRPVCLPACLPACLPVCLSVCLSAVLIQSINLLDNYVCLSVYSSFYQSFCLSVSVIDSLSVCSGHCQSVSLSPSFIIENRTVCFTFRQSVCFFSYRQSLCLFRSLSVSLSLSFSYRKSYCLFHFSTVCLSVFSVIDSLSVCSGHRQSVSYRHSLCLPHPGLFQTFCLSVTIWPVFSSVFSSFASVTVYLLMIIITRI